MANLPPPTGTNRVKNFWADKPEELLSECVITLQQCKVMMQCCLLRFNRNFQCLKLPEVYINMIRRESIFFKIPFVCSYESRTLRLCNHTNADALFGFFLQVFFSGFAMATGKLLDPVGITRKMSFPRTRRRIPNAGIEPGVSNLSITSPTLYH